MTRRCCRFCRRRRRLHHRRAASSAVAACSALPPPPPPLHNAGSESVQTGWGRMLRPALRMHNSTCTTAHACVRCACKRRSTHACKSIHGGGVVEASHTHTHAVQQVQSLAYTFTCIHIHLHAKCKCTGLCERQLTCA